MALDHRLAARYAAAVAFASECNPANQVDAFFFATELPAARLELGDSTDTATLAPPPAGAADPDTRCDGTFGRYLAIRGDEATLAWPQDTVMACRTVH